MIYCLMYFPLFEGALCLSLFCYALLCVHFSFTIILKGKKMLVSVLLLSYRCIVAINDLWLFLTMPWVGLQCAIVVVPDHTHLRLKKKVSWTKPIIKSGSFLATYFKNFKVYNPKDKRVCGSCPLSILK